MNLRTLLILLPFLPAAAMADVRNVQTSEVFTTIQAAVDDNDTLAGHTLQVLGPTHSDGQTVISKNLTLEGENGSETVLMNENTGDSGDARAWFLVNAGINLTIRNLAFDGNGFDVHQAFRHRGTGSFNNVSFNDIQFPPYAGTAIVSFGGNVDISNSRFTSIGRVGVLYFGTGITASNFNNNMYTGKGDGDFLDYALEVGGGAVVTSNGNTISGNRGVASVDGSTSAGILVSTFFGAGSQLTSNNDRVTASTSGVAMGFDTSDSAALFMNRGYISDNDFGITTTAATNILSVTNSCILNNSNIGIELDGLTVTANNNNITGNGVGLDGGSGDATNNWWGSAGGPGGGGDTVENSTVNFSPFLTAIAEDTPCSTLQPIPSLNQYGIWLIALLLFMFGLYGISRSRKQA